MTGVVHCVDCILEIIAGKSGNQTMEHFILAFNDFSYRQRRAATVGGQADDRSITTMVVKSDRLR